ncbi:MAG: DUF1929 domain-containing protein [Actinobacteria bacterium]|nr:DUF1929 domain-containing protein [Actinomycetota bacterium]
MGLASAALLNAIPLVSAAGDWLQEREIHSAPYKRARGHWQLVEVPGRSRVNAVHAVLLRSGRVLLVSGSGNKRDLFEKQRFRSMIWDPATNRFSEVPTPSDLFCAGQAFLSDGRVLIAGGTKRYERLKIDVTNAAGVIKLMRATPGATPIKIPVGTMFIRPNGMRYRTEVAVTLPADSNGSPTPVETWIAAEQPGARGVIQVDYRRPRALSPDPVGPFAGMIRGSVSRISLATQDYWGSRQSYIFDPTTERYRRVADLTQARWYPTLVGIGGGKILAVSGLDDFGRVDEAGRGEIFDPSTRRWTKDRRVERFFPTYPSLFLTRGGDLFYSGANSGYGRAAKNPPPGIWNITSNTWRTVPRLRYRRMGDAATSVLLPPAQRQQVAIFGGAKGGEVGGSTARVDVVDLTRRVPRYVAAGRLPNPTRYAGGVVTPDDRVLILGGAGGYRGRGDSDLRRAYSFNPRDRSLTELARPTVGRDYHSEALLLPDGRVATFGSDPLYGKTGGKAAFEQRIEVYTPPYLFKGPRPVITAAPRAARRGATIDLRSPDAIGLLNVRLIRPSAVTHTTDVEQRSIAVGVVRRRAARITVKIPVDATIIPAGWYMLVATNAKGVPSAAKWIRID